MLSRIIDHKFQCLMCGQWRTPQAMRDDGTANGGRRCRRCHEALVRANQRRNVPPDPREAKNLAARLSRYRLPRAEYDQLMLDQGGTCAICDQPPPPEKRLVIDHNHADGRVRMLLCSNCNIGLGMFEDDPDRLKAASDYVRVFHSENRRRIEAGLPFDGQR